MTTSRRQKLTLELLVSGDNAAIYEYKDILIRYTLIFNVTCISILACIKENLVSTLYGHHHVYINIINTYYAAMH
jgi:hypothetical protein